MGFGTVTTSSGGFGKVGKADLSTTEGLAEQARILGYSNEVDSIVNKKPKLSFLQRLGKGLGAFNPAEALLTGNEKGFGAGVKSYVTGIGKGIGSALTGTDYEGERRTFSDVAEKMGVENGIAKFGIGFVGDVLLDPTTYFGGAIAKGVGIVSKGVGNTALKAVGRIAPETEAGLRMAGTGLQDALGRAFAYGYKSSKGAKEEVLTYLSKQQKAKIGLATSNLNRLGTGVLTKAQREELALKMIAGKRAEFVARNPESIADISVKPKLQTKIKLEDDYSTIEKFTKAEMQHNVLTELELSKAGRRISIDADPDAAFGTVGSERLASAEKSTFPKWIPDTLRKKSLVETVRKHIIDGTVPQKADEIRLYNVVAEKMGLIEKVDNMAALDVPSINFDDAVGSGAKKTPGEIGREAALQGTSPEVAKVIESQIERSKKLGDLIGLENPYEVYFPFIKKDKLSKFINESQSIKVGSEGYRKQFKNLLTNENMELDPAKVFFTREAQIVSDKMTRDFLKGFVKRHGKPVDAFKSVDEALKAGYTLIKEKGNFGKELGYVSKWDGALIRDSINPEFQSIDMLAKATGFDAISSLFKRSVTGLFAPFHVRNFVSGNIQNFEVLGVDALNPQNIAAGQKIAYLLAKGEKIPAGTVTVAGKTMKMSDVIKPFSDRFSGDTFYTNDFMLALDRGGDLMQAAKTFSKERIKETVKTLGVGQEAIPFKIAKGIGQYIEQQQKATAYITALNQGKSIQEALRLAEASGFDYRALTRFESQIMRRIIPFYSFTRKNIELQLKTLGENPQRINQVLSFFENAGEGFGGGSLTEEEKKYLPSFIKESLGVKLQDTPDGLKQYVSSFGTPIEAFTQLFGENPILRTVSQMNPILKVPIEIGIGKDSFRQRDLKDVYSANEYKLAPQVVKDLLEIKEVKKDVMKRTKDGKLVKTGERIEYIADPVRLLIARSLFTSRGVTYLDQVFGNDMQGLAKFVKATTGTKIQQVDLEKQKYFTDRDQQREIEDVLLRTGEVKKFERLYIPKEKKGLGK